MRIISRIKNKLRAVAQARGTANFKRRLWNREFENGRWNHISDTSDDFIHPLIDRYINGGAIVDLGCGVGSIGLEMPQASYRSYTGVDISDVALAQARAAATSSGRAESNQFINSGIEEFLPEPGASVILLSECLYYIPKSRIPDILRRLGSRLGADGVLLIRLCDRDAYVDYAKIAKTCLRVVEEVHDKHSAATALVCRP